jgi:hypothetical protein
VQRIAYRNIEIRNTNIEIRNKFESPIWLRLGLRQDENTKFKAKFAKGEAESGRANHFCDFYAINGGSGSSYNIINPVRRWSIVEKWLGG